MFSLVSLFKDFTANRSGLRSFSFREKRIQTDCNTVNEQIILYFLQRGGGKESKPRISENVLGEKLENINCRVNKCWNFTFVMQKCCTLSYFIFQLFRIFLNLEIFQNFLVREKLVVFHGKERCVNFCIRKDIRNSVSITHSIGCERNNWYGEFCHIFNLSELEVVRKNPER